MIKWIRRPDSQLPWPLAASLAFAFAGCAVGPNYHRPDLAVPAEYKSANAAEKAPVIADQQWWLLFHDDALTQLVEDTIKSNFDIRAAIARVDEARAATKQARAAFFPTLDLGASARRSGTAFGTSTLYSVPLSASYEADIWGRLRRQYEYYKASEAASADDLVLVQQTAAAAMAEAYFNLQFYDREIKIYQQALELFRKQLDLTNTKYTAGLALPTDLLQAKTEVNTATNQLIEVRRSRIKQEHAIALLLGRTPSDFELGQHPADTIIPVLPAGIPMNLLNRRPDVAENERKLVAANAEIGVAVANFLPSFSIGGSAGFESNSGSRLLDWESRFWTLTPAATLPIFHGGALRAAYEQNRARYRELLANYHTSVIGAFRDVEDELSDLHLLADKAASLEQTIVSAREYSRLTELQYRQGLTGYLQVIDANQTLLTNELSAADAENQRLASTVLLIKALGGGWNDPNAPH